ncbi:MAG: xanthine dehydrogenase family protein subunit M [Bacillota bacterium]
MYKMRYAAPRTLTEALRLLGEEREGVYVVAGSTNVLPDLRAKKIRPSLLLSIEKLGELKGIHADGDVVTVGALTTINELLASRDIELNAGILHQAAQRFADPLVRNRATIGGNLANASPAADSAVPLLALDAVLDICSARGEREVPLSSFFTGPGKTVLERDELIRAVRFPSDSENQKAFIKFGLREAMAISLVSVGVELRIQKDEVAYARVAFGAVAPTPMRGFRTEEFLVGKKLTAEVLDEARQVASREVRPISDVRATESYRRHISGVLLGRAIKMALGGGMS